MEEEVVMANLSKIKRDQMLAFLEELKSKNNDDDSIRAINEIENQLRSKKYGLVWEEHSEQVDDLLKENIPVLVEDPERRLCKDETKPWNFIIEGDNLQALYLLEKTHKGKVDCIYIDPPYNTGARDWKYNNDYVDGSDEYRHSKWLSMMKNRLILAKKLLNRKESVLIITIDEKEYAHLGCLLEEIFPESRIQMISTVINHAGTSRNNEFSRINEFIYFVMIGGISIEPLATNSERKEGVLWDSLRRHNPNNIRDAQHPNQFYPIYVNNTTKQINEIGAPIPFGVDSSTVASRPGCTTVLPIREDGTEMMWGVMDKELKRRLSGGYVRVGKYYPNNPQKYSIQFLSKGTIDDIEQGKAVITGKDKNGAVIAFYPGGKKMMPSNQWDISTHDARDHGTKLIKTIFSDLRFTFPKSLYAVHDSLNYFIRNKKEAIVLDFFAGSGTTMHAVNLLNAEDDGIRTCIMVTNNEISENEEREFLSNNIHKGDLEWENKGVAKYVTWPRTLCTIEGHDINGNPLKGKYLGSDISMSDGFEANVKYLKCDWTPRKPEDYLLSNALLLHIKELIELHTAKEIDGVKNIILYSKSDYDNYLNNEEKYKLIENVWVNENILFNSSEMKKLKKKKYKYIPREFFSQELKEVGEYV